MRPISAPAASTRICRPKLIDDIETWCHEFPPVIDDIEGLLTGNRIFKQRNVDIGIVSEKDVFDWGFSGVMARGSGLQWDLRRSQPYEIYSELDFKNSNRQERRLLRPLSLPRRGDCASPPRSCCNASICCVKRPAR